MPANDSCVHYVWRKIVYKLLELGRNEELTREVVVKLYFERSPRCCQCSARVFMTALFISKTWKQPEWHSVDEWINYGIAAVL